MKTIGIVRYDLATSTPMFEHGFKNREEVDERLKVIYESHSQQYPHPDNIISLKQGVAIVNGQEILYIAEVDIEVWDKQYCVGKIA